MKAIRSKAIRIGSMAFVVGIIAAQTRCADDSESKTSPSSCTQSTVPKNYACTTNFALGIPDWIKDNFTCVQVTDDGTNYVFATEDVPSYNSMYFGTCDSRYEAAPGTNRANPNLISIQNYVIKVPKNPEVAANPTDVSLTTVGVATNGIVYFDNMAAPPDNLVNELATMDAGNGHPTNTGTYHYHAEPYKLTDTDPGAFVGVARDGFPVFGPKEADGTTNPQYVGGANCNPTKVNERMAGTNDDAPDNCQPLAISNFHCHEIAGATFFPDIYTCHYHVDNGPTYMLDKFAGTPGSFTNN